ncbi:hypothetical protein DEU56DRAFT_859474 [Suillus clintonianus]|uniref:uncharacterized protein n=1 Tax=Suillus clintonianus TaxID=1904413 RepID=UPI001B88603E|nr:uncharacterized protein DEU56DRAFT_859474 [Suillus clintonianus]KAG2132812.1 hypothetical protein DEU56DRAFT_859474 [Suillus clintonianus]
MKMLLSPQVDVHILRSHKNNLAHISGLPPEILAAVFRNFIEEQDHPKNGTPTCVIVTHVCRHWRQVALECSTLWRYIIYTPARWLGIMLERSKNAALVVEYDVTVSLRDCLEQILSQLPRIKVLRLSSLSSLDIDRTIHLLSSQPASLLEIFEFSVVMFGLPTTKPISNTTFQGQAPRLRSVVLTSCNFSWTSCIFNGLRTLCVRGTGTTSYPTLPQLLSALRRMPALEQLTLEQLSIISEETKLLDKVPLTRLKSVALGAASIRTATSLFAQLALPVDAKIALQLTQVQGVQDFSDLFSAMNRHPVGSGSVVQSLRAIHLSHRSFCVQFSTSMAINTVYSWNPCDDDIRLSIQFTFTSAEVDPSIIFDICQTVTRDRIQKFSFGSEFDLPGRDFWRAGSSFLMDLKIIHVNSSFIGGLIAALEIIKGKKNSDIAYPSLRVLEFEAVDFEEDEPEEFRDVIKIRAKHGVPIHTLRLAECKNLRADQVQGFREVVATVDWDEYDDSEEPLGDTKSDFSSSTDDAEAVD